MAFNSYPRRLTPVAWCLQTLLTQLLTPIQATRYLLAGHPFTWNGLAFAHALTAAPATHGMPAL